ncbi:MAG: HAD-IIIC family phosphatase [Bacteroidia bacterium]|nr:HAD-IIIC family phosphatase [Bacteroidia bacterium]
MEGLKYHIFRNSTIEILFEPFNVSYGGYNDIAHIPAADAYLWFFLLPINTDIETLTNEIKLFSDGIEYILSNIPSTKQIIAFDLIDLLNYRWQNADFRVKNAINNYNNKLYQLTSQHSNLKVFEFSDFLSQHHHQTFIDWKFYYISQTIISPKLAKPFQLWFSEKINALLSKRKKCLILDLDNTLWGGVLGEDGIHGIKLGNSYPGNSFVDFQKAILEANKNGIILAICSKNNESDVFEAFEKHPQMILKRSNFSAYRINWNNKAANIAELATELNIGIDSFVFLDDSPVERSFVINSLPDVVVPDFPKQPYELLSFFNDVYKKYFQIYLLTNEDKTKTLQYQENKIRNDFKNNFTDTESFIKNLNIEISVSLANSFNISRIAQMTQKTNQFNLTTKRYSENEIQNFIDNKHIVICASVKDKFGDNGITALCISKIDLTSKKAYIDTFLMSCRILGRNIENVFLSYVLNKLHNKGIVEVEASFIKSAKNMQVENFYDNFGFSLSDNTDNIKQYVLRINKTQEIKDYYKIIEPV